MKVALYARVSKEEAGKDGRLQDPETQLRQLRKFCDAMSWPIAETYIDRCSGGDSNRPQFQAMLGRVRQRHFDLILVWRLDRFSREGIQNTMGYIRQLRDYKVALKSVEESYVDTRQEGITELILSILAWAGAEERRKISENTKAGLDRARSEGKILGRHPSGCVCPKHVAATERLYGAEYVKTSLSAIAKTPPPSLYKEKPGFGADQKTAVFPEDPE